MELTHELNALFVTRAQEGDSVAVNRLLEGHKDRLYRFAYRLCRNRDEAGDLVAESMLRAFRSMRTFKGDSEIGTWLFRILLNVFFDARKRATRFEVYQHEEGGDHFIDANVASGGVLPDASVIEELRSQRVRNAIERLPQMHREIILLFHIEGWSYEEVAHLCQIPIGTVRSRLNRARALLSAQLLEEEEFLTV